MSCSSINDIGPPISLTWPIKTGSNQLQSGRVYKPDEKEIGTVLSDGLSYEGIRRKKQRDAIN